jgi:serine/threonine protein kinase
MPLAPGRRLGPYEILGAIGVGGMGEVYRARDTRLKRQVAIKVLPQDKAADPECHRRLLQEARAASALNHPNIVALHDIYNDGSVDYLAMEFVSGHSLDNLISSKRLSLPQVVSYGAQTADALAVAHAAGIVHRDIKPANVMLTDESQIKILDFGVAKLASLGTCAGEETLTDESALTKSGALVGTVAYMSPEQTAGGTLDHRTDIFSLGVVLYEMLAGNHPFRRQSNVETMHAIACDAPPALAKPLPEFGEILDKAMAKDPKERYQHAGDLALDLRRFQRAWEARTLLSQKPAAGTTPRRGMEWALVTVIAVLALVLVLWARRGSGSPEDENPLSKTTFARFTDFPGDKSDSSISPDGKFVAFRAYQDGRSDAWVGQVGTGRFVNLTKDQEEDSLIPIQNLGFSPDGTDLWLAGYQPVQRLRLIPLMGGRPRAFLRDHTANVAWSPDGRRLVFHTYDPGDPMFVADGDGANAHQIFNLGPGEHNHFPAWSTDGRWIYFVSGPWESLDMDLWRIAAAGGKPERLTHHNSDVRSVAPISSRTVLYVAPQQDGSGPWLWAIDVERKLSRCISFGLEHYISISASANHNRLVATVSNPTARLWSVPILDRLSTEADIRPFPVLNERALAPRFAANSLFYLSSYGTGDGLWRFQNGETFEVWKGAEGPLLVPPAISPDARHAAIVLRKQGKLRLHIISADGTELQSLTDSVEVRGAPGWSPDGKWIVTGGDDASGPGLFKIPAEGGVPVRLPAKAGLNPVWSPDGTLIVYAGTTISRFAPLLAVRPDGHPFELPPIGVGAGTGINRPHHRFMPDGKGLIYLRGLDPGQDFWLLDLTTGKTKLLARLGHGTSISFDITPDGRQIVFDRVRENSDIVLIDRPS